MAEVKIMTVIVPHVNVVSLIGACTSSIHRMRLYVLTEFCEYGSLKDYLTKHWHLFENRDLAEVSEPMLSCSPIYGNDCF